MSTPQSIRSHPKWTRLVDLVRELAFIDGGSDTAFTLASGRQSRWFFDTKPVMMHPEASHLIGEMLNLRMDELGADFVGGDGECAALHARGVQGVPRRVGCAAV